MTARLPPAREALPADLKAFFDTYREAFNRLDGAAVARLYAVPSGIASDRGYTHWPAFEPIRDNMDALCALYREHGFAASHFDIAAFIPQGDDHAVADLAWTIERTDGQDAWCFHTTYNLVRRGRGWRVLLCTAYQEEALAPKDEAPADAQATLGLTIAAPPVVLETVAAASGSHAPATDGAAVTVATPSAANPDASEALATPSQAAPDADEDMPVAEPPEVSPAPAHEADAHPTDRAADAPWLEAILPSPTDVDVDVDAAAAAAAAGRPATEAAAAPPATREPSAGAGRGRRPRRGGRGTAQPATEAPVSGAADQGPAQAVLPMDAGPEALQAGRADAPQAKPKPRRPRSRSVEPSAQDTVAQATLPAEASGVASMAQPPAPAPAPAPARGPAPAPAAVRSRTRPAQEAARTPGDGPRGKPARGAQPEVAAPTEEAAGRTAGEPATAKPRARRRRPAKGQPASPGGTADPSDGGES